MIEMHFWEQLSVVAREGNLSAASEVLHITQPALSRSMKKLEELLDVELFIHEKNRITLSETGKLAAKMADMLLEEEATAIERIRNLEMSKRTIKIGTCASLPGRVLLSAVCSAFPSMNVSLEIAQEDRLLRMLTEDSIQIAVLRKSIKDFDLCSSYYFKEEMLLAVTPLNPLAGRKSVTMEDINGQAVLIPEGTGFWTNAVRNGLPDSRLLVQTDLSSYMTIAQSSDIPFFYSDWHLRNSSPPEGREYIPISDGQMKVDYYCVYKRKDRARFEKCLVYDGQ